MAHGAAQAVFFWGDWGVFWSFFVVLGHKLQIQVDWSTFFFQVVFRQKLMQMEGLEAWEYQNGASIDVLYTMVGSNCRLVG